VLDAPRILRVGEQLTAAVHLTVSRSEIRHVMGPGLAEVRAAVAGQGLTATGPWLTHHLRMDPAIFDFEICVPVGEPVTPSGRVRPGRLPAATVARAIYRGGYEGLGAAWGGLEAWIRASGREPAAGLWEVYAVGPETSGDPADWQTELNRPLRA
jgi:effector-binding domain-containing protein